MVRVLFAEDFRLRGFSGVPIRQAFVEVLVLVGLVDEVVAVF